MGSPSQDFAYTIYPVGDRGMTAQWGEGIDERTNDYILGVFQWLKEKRIPGVTDFIPAYQSLTLVYDPVLVRRATGASSAYDWLYGELSRLLDDQREWHPVPSRNVDIPVCYDPSLGPDQPRLCEERGVSPEVLAGLHAGPLYKVYMLGFLPGFAYMGTVDERIASPRRLEPVLRIPKGSVGIAGLQTGVYPVESPGGWNIIGRTPLAMFDPASEHPVFLRAGDRVRFVPITLEAYYGYTGH